jgi:hypothetical protein
MKMKQYLIVITVLFLQFLSSCGIGEDELEYYFHEIKKIHMYNIDSSTLFLHLSQNGPSLYTEEYIRQNGDFFIFQNGSARSRQAALIASLLDNAKPVNINPEKNIVQTKKMEGLDWIKDGGFVIDIYGINGNIIKTYIMQNGLRVFYEKGKEGIYYETPRILLNKFSISEKEFLSAYIKSIRHRNRLARQPQ